MNGQWIGTYEGSTTGTIVVNIDERSSHYQGVAYLLESDAALPSSAAFFTTKNKEQTFAFRTDPILAIDSRSGSLVGWDALKSRYRENMPFSRYADVQGSFEEDALNISWTTDTGVTGRSTMPRSKADQPSELHALAKDWNAYKEHVASIEGRRYLFRGQNKPWRLRTSFHRTGRADLTRFLREDIQILHKQLSARTTHVFNLQIPDENGAFFNLIQHHGYPSPLLDWSYSPYVAAFFAYRGISNSDAATATESDSVRILVFDYVQWARDLQQVPLAMAPWPHVSFFEFIAIENERMIPQQAASMVTNVDDIEGYVRQKESDSKKYLSAIDLPKRDRRSVMRELAYMGITAGSMFPGLDGACEELTERNFQV